MPYVVLEICIQKIDKEGKSFSVRNFYRTKVTEDQKTNAHRPIIIKDDGLFLARRFVPP